MGNEPGVARRLEELRAAARYDRERRDLYHAKVLGSRPTSVARLEELRRIAALSASRLRRVEREASDTDDFASVPRSTPQTPTRR
jgi:hypothetical protein